VVMMVMTNDEKFDQMKKDIERLTHENSTLKTETRPEIISPSTRNFQELMLSLRRVLDMKEEVIRKLKFERTNSNYHVQLAKLNTLNQKKNLVRLVEVLNEGAPPNQRQPSKSVVVKTFGECLSEVCTPQIESNNSIGRMTSHEASPNTHKLHNSTKTVTVGSGNDKDNCSIRTERVACRSSKELTVIFGRKNTEITDKMNKIAHNRREIARAEKTIMDLQSEVSLYQKMSPDKNFKTWTSMLSLKEGQIKTKNIAIEEMVRQNKTLINEIENISREMTKIHSSNKQKLWNLKHIMRNHLRVLHEQDRKDKRFVFELRTRLAVSFQASRRTMVMFNQFRELQSINFTIQRFYSDLGMIKSEFATFNVLKVQSKSEIATQPALKSSPTLHQKMPAMRASHQPTSQNVVLSTGSNDFKNLVVQKHKRIMNEQKLQSFKSKLTGLAEQNDSETKLEGQLFALVSSLKADLLHFTKQILPLKQGLEKSRDDIEKILLRLSMNNQAHEKGILMGPLEKSQEADLVSELRRTLNTMADQLRFISEKVILTETFIGKSDEITQIKAIIEEMSRERGQGFAALASMANFIFTDPDQCSDSDQQPSRFLVNVHESLDLKEKGLVNARIQNSGVLDEQASPKMKERRITQKSGSSVDPEGRSSSVSGFVQKLNDIVKDLPKSKTTQKESEQPSHSDRLRFSTPTSKLEFGEVAKREKLEEQVQYLLGIITSYEKAFDALKKEQDKKNERKMVKSHLKSKELESALDMIKTKPYSNFHLFLNSSENLNSFKEISDKLQNNITSLKELDAHAVEQILTDTHARKQSGGDPFSDQFIRNFGKNKCGVENDLVSPSVFNTVVGSGRGNSRHLSVHSNSSPVKEFSHYSNQLSPSGNQGPNSQKVNLARITLILQKHGQRAKEMIDHFSNKTVSLEKALTRVKSVVKSLKGKLTALKEERDGLKKTADSLKSHTLALRLKDQTEKNSHLSEFLYQVTRLMTQHTMLTNIDEMPHDQIIQKLKENLQGVRSSSMKTSDLIAKVEELTMKNVKHTSELDLQKEELHELNLALESEIMRADNAVRHHENDRQTLRKQLLQLTQEKVEIEDANERLRTKVAVLESDFKDQQQTLKSLYESLCKVQYSQQADFSFAEALKRRDQSMSIVSKVAMNDQDEISFDDIASRFMKKEHNSDFLNEGPSEKFIKQFDEAKVAKDFPESVKLTKRTNSILEELYEDEKQEAEKACPKKENIFAVETTEDKRVGIKCETTEFGIAKDQENPFDNFLQKKTIDFSLNSEQSIRDLKQPITSDRHNPFDQSIEHHPNEPDDFANLFKPKYVTEDELESLRDTDPDKPAPSNIEGVELFSFKHSP
jgi:hypothetical protein